MFFSPTFWSLWFIKTRWMQSKSDSLGLLRPVFISHISLTSHVSTSLIKHRFIYVYILWQTRAVFLGDVQVKLLRMYTCPFWGVKPFRQRHGVTFQIVGSWPSLRGVFHVFLQENCVAFKDRGRLNFFERSVTSLKDALHILQQYVAKKGCSFK